MAINDFLGLTTRMNKAWNAKRSDLIYQQLRITKRKAEDAFAQYLSNDYTIYDVVAENGFANLASKPVGKYICVWKNGQSVGKYTGGYDMRANFFTRHTDVVIMGVKINSQNAIVKILPFVAFDFKYGTDINDYDYNYKLTIQLTNFVIGTGSSPYSIKKVKFLDCFMEELSSNSFNRFYSCAIDRCKIGKTENSIWFQYEQEADSLINVLENNFFEGSPSSACYFRLNKKLTLKNTHIKNFSQGSGNYRGDFQGVGGVQVLNFDNVLFENFKLLMGQLKNDNLFPIYVKDINFYAGDYSNYKFKQGYSDRQKFLSDDATEWALDIEGIMTNENYTNLPVIISTQIQNFRVAGNEYSRRYYQLSFQSDKQFDDAFKTMFAREQSILVWWRDDLDQLLVNAIGGAKKVKNLTLYENNGTTLFDYRNNENFMMVAKDAEHNRVVLCWYEGLVFPTVFTDFFNDIEYTIERCFQILEPPEQVVWRNLLYDYANNSEFINSPIEGSALFQEMTSIFVDKR